MDNNGTVLLHKMSDRQNRIFIHRISTEEDNKPLVIDLQYDHTGAINRLLTLGNLFSKLF